MNVETLLEIGKNAIGASCRGVSGRAGIFAVVCRSHPHYFFEGEYETVVRVETYALCYSCDGPFAVGVFV